MALSDHFKQPGMPLSVGLHTAVLVASVMTFSSPRPLPDPVEAVSVEVVDESQIREVTKGEQSAKQAAPTPRVDRVAPKVEQNAPGEAKKQINTDATPKPQEVTAKEERKEVAAVVIPPPPLRPVIPPPPKPIETPKPAAVAPAKPAPSKQAEEEEEAEEAIRQAAKKKLEQQKLEQQRADEQKKKLEEQKKLADQKKKLEEQQRKEEEAERQEEIREAAEAKKREEQKKLADAKAADAKKAEDTKRAQEAAKKAADEKKKRDADQQARNQAAADSARRALLASREAPSNSGNTGEQVSRTPAAGAQTATGAKLNPSDKSALIGIISDQIEAKLYQTGVSKPRVLPQLRLQVTSDGTVASVSLINSSGEPGFQALAEAGIRAARQASPLRIPSRFTPMYGDWRSIVIQVNPSE